MADLTIFQLTQLLPASVDAANDLFPIWDNSATETKKITVDDLKTVLGTPALADSNIFVGNASNIATAVSLTLNATGGAFGLSNTGVLTMPNANGSTRGLLTAADWTTFNNKSTIADWTSGFTSTLQATSTWTATNAGNTNVNAAIIPKGNGALLVDAPDGTTAGGISRGQFAVDLQHSRSVSNQVAAGNYGVLTGGQDNQLGGGTHCFIGGGFSNYGFNNYFVICGGYDNTNGGASAFVGGGQSNNLTSGSYAVLVGGDTNYINGNWGFLGGGYQNQLNEQFTSISGGRQANAFLYGMQAYSAGQFSALADAQYATIQMRAAITGTAITDLFLDGSSVRPILPATNALWAVRVQIVAICTNVGGGSTLVLGASFAAERQCAIKRLNTTTSLVGAVQTIGANLSDTTMSTSAVTITADDTNEALRIQFTPPSTAGPSSTIRVVATIQLTQVKY